MQNPSQRRNSSGGRIALSVSLALLATGVGTVTPTVARAQQSTSSANERLITLELRDARLQAAIQALAASSGLNNFVIEPVEGKTFGLVTVRLTDQPLSKAVEMVASSAGAILTYEDGIYHLRPRTEADNRPAPKPVPVEAPVVVAQTRPRNTQYIRIPLNFILPSDFVQALGNPGYLTMVNASANMALPTNTKSPLYESGESGVRQMLEKGQSLLPQPAAPASPLGHTGGAGGSAGRDGGLGEQGAQGIPGGGFGGGRFGGGGGFGAQGFGGGQGGAPFGGGGGQGGPGGGPGQGQNGGFRASIPGIQNIYSNDADNALLVEYDNVEDLNRLREIVRLLDVKPKQVQIKAEFVSVAVNDADSFGIDWTFQPARNLSGAIPPISGAGSTSIVLAYASGNAVANMRAALTKSRTNILQAPIISTINNRQANISVTNSVSITQQTVIPGGLNSTPITATYQVNVPASNFLTVLPHINGDNSITMTIQPQLQSIVLRGDGGVDSSTDNLITTRIVQNGETMVLGGFISKQEGVNLQKVPLLSDLPIIGNLFTQRSTTVVGTETLIFITPTIIEDQSQGVVGTGGASPAPTP